MTASIAQGTLPSDTHTHTHMRTKHTKRARTHIRTHTHSRSTQMFVPGNAYEALEMGVRCFVCVLCVCVCVYVCVCVCVCHAGDFINPDADPEGVVADLDALVLHLDELKAACDTYKVRACKRTRGMCTRTVHAAHAMRLVHRRGMEASRHQRCKCTGL